jgi:hypothetical protein
MGVTRAIEEDAYATARNTEAKSLLKDTISERENDMKAILGCESLVYSGQRHGFIYVPSGKPRVQNMTACTIKKQYCSTEYESDVVKPSKYAFGIIESKGEKGESLEAWSQMEVSEHQDLQ